LNIHRIWHRLKVAFKAGVVVDPPCHSSCASELEERSALRKSVGCLSKWCGNSNCCTTSFLVKHALATLPTCGPRRARGSLPPGGADTEPGDVRIATETPHFV